MHQTSAGNVLLPALVFTVYEPADLSNISAIIICLPFSG